MPKHGVALMDGRAFSKDELSIAAAQLLELSDGEKVWLFEGDMGSGKTTLIKELCILLGVSSSMSSPTFSIINEYASQRGSIFHFDFYRLKKETEAYDIGVDEYLESGKFCFVEWPDKIKTLAPARFFKVKINFINPSQRTIEYSHD